MAKIQPLKGFRDFYPEDIAKRSYVFRVWRETARRYGFQEYDAPPLESLELYTLKSGAEISDQLYAFTDKGGRPVSMRAEMTPSVARMVAAKWHSLPKPIKWFSIPQLFRYERPQAGRLREHFQLNVDIFGDGSIQAEASILCCLIDMFTSFGFDHTQIKLRVSNRQVLNRVLNSIGITSEQQSAVYAVLDKYTRTPVDVSVGRLREAGISTETIEKLFDIVDQYRTIVRGQEIPPSLVAIEDGQDKLTPLLYELHNRIPDGDKWIVFDLTIVRGLDYYTGLVFEAFDTEQTTRAICGGGRYDGLLSQLGGVSGEAIGFGCGDVVLSMLLDRYDLFPAGEPRVDILLSNMSSLAPEHFYGFARRFRSLGLNVDTIGGFDIAKLKARGNECRAVLSIGSDYSVYYDIASGKKTTLRAFDAFINFLESRASVDASSVCGANLSTLARNEEVRHRDYRGRMAE